MAAVTLLASCSSIPTRDERLQAARDTAPAGYRDVIVATQNFDLLSFVPASSFHNEEIIVFIEGDGFAWLNKTTPSQDPTPITQTVLSLLRSSARPNAIYLARPCQFVGPTNGNCAPRLWMTARYSDEVIDAMNEALNALKNEFAASEVWLVGHSGGGTIATLLAATRSDVSKIVTIAAPLDIDAFTSHHGVTPMSASLNPTKHVAALSNTPQLHLFGSDDKTVPEHLVQTYLDALPSKDCVQTKTVPATHQAGWGDLEPHPLDMTTTCKANRP